MTVQCAILNPRCTIFASDSGITTPDGKKYDGMQKIFKLSDIHPAKIMINGNMEFENIPIITIIKEFENKTDFTELKTIEEIKDNLLSFVHNYSPTSDFDEYISYIVEDFKETLSLEIEEEEFNKVISTKRRKEIYPFIKKYSKFDSEFDEIIPENKYREKYRKILWEIFSYELRYAGTGIIIAGHDINSPYPSFFELNIHCNDEDRVIFEEIESKIDFEDTIIRIYAMNEEGYTFFTGVNEEFIDFIHGYFTKTNARVIQKLKWKFKKENIPNNNEIVNIIKQTINEEYSDLNNQIEYFKSIILNDTFKSIEFIPNNILCILADEIIRLTGIKQKISSEDEYVSIKSHVSLMTKSHGFKWAKFDDEII